MRRPPTATQEPLDRLSRLSQPHPFRHDCSGVLNRLNVACVRQVVTRPDCIGDLSERIGVLLPRVPPLVAFKLAREGVISKHVADPS